MDCLYDQNFKKWLTQSSSVGLEFKYKSQEVFSYLALVFEDSFQTTLLMSLSQSYSNTYRELAGKWIDFKVRLFFIKFFVETS